MLKLIKKIEQEYQITVAGEQIGFTIRPGALSDMDIAYVAGLEAADKAGLQDRDGLFTLRAGRTLLLQRIVGWSGVGLPSGEEAPCTAEYLDAFFVAYPGALRELSDAIRARDEAVEKN